MSKHLKNPFIWLSIILLGVNAYQWRDRETNNGPTTVPESISKTINKLSVDMDSWQKTVSRYRSIEIPFTQKMVSNDRSGTLILGKVFTISPEVEGTFDWYTPFKARFVPKNTLPACSTYTITVSPELKALSGAHLSEPQRLSFNTGTLELTSASQSSLDNKKAVISLRFNDKVSADELARYIEVSQSVDIAKPYSEAAADNELMYRLPKGKIDKEIAVEVYNRKGDDLLINVRKGLRGISGPAGITADVSKTVTLDSDVHIRELYTNESYNNKYISLQLNHDVELEELKQHLIINPHVDYHCNEQSGSYFKLRGDFEANTEYHIMLSDGIRTKGGVVSSHTCRKTKTFGSYESDLVLKGEGNYMQLSGSMMLPVETVNISKIKLTLHKVHTNNIVHYFRDGYDYSYGSNNNYAKEVFTKEYDVSDSQNLRVSNYLDLKSLTGGKSGVYHLYASFKDATDDYWRSWEGKQRIILVSDISISAKFSDKDVFVWANSLSRNRPSTNSVVTVYTKQNQILVQGKTDYNGVAHLSYSPEEGTPYLVTVTNGIDTAVLTKKKTLIDTTGFKVDGLSYLVKGYEGFIYSDRGVYRPGETVHLQGLVRAPGISFPKRFPVECIIEDPAGITALKETRALSITGRVSVDTALPDTAMTGQYSVTIRIPGTTDVIGRYKFLVEEFVPDTIKVQLTADKKAYRLNETVSLTVDAEYLFGAKAGGLKGDTRYTLKPVAFKHELFPGYSFTNSAVSLRSKNMRNGSFSLDESGATTVKVKLPSDIAAKSDAEVMFSASVKDEGGSAVTAFHKVHLETNPFFIGLRKEREGYVIPGRKEKFNIRVITRKGESFVGLQEALRVNVYKQYWNWALKEVNGRYRYEVDKTESLVTSFSANDDFLYSPDESGDYRMEIIDERSGISTDISFECYGGYESSTSKTRPDILELSVDKESYRPGEFAEVVVKSPFAGIGMLTIESNHVLEYMPFVMTEKTKKLRVPLKNEYGKQFYFSVTVLKDGKRTETASTVRAFGVIPVTMDYSDKKLNITTKVPEVIRPGNTLTVDMIVRNNDGLAEQADVTVAVVDEGICQLTDFKTPSPLDWFYGKRALGVATYDMFSLLMPDIDRKNIGFDSVFGGGSVNSSRDGRMFNVFKAKRVRPVALWSSTITTARNGKANFSCVVPDHFSGKLRVMVVAARQRQFGSSESFVTVQPPFVIKPSFPRFAAPNDTFTIPVVVFNKSGRSGDVSISIKGGDLNAKKVIALNNDKSYRFDVPCTAPAVPGIVTYTISVSDGQETSHYSVELPVRPVMTLHSINGSGVVENSTEFSFPGNWAPGTDKGKLTFSPLPGLLYAEALDYVVDYPYGCLEQTTSKTFPLLYLKSVAQLVSKKLTGEAKLKDAVQHGIERIQSMQLSDGGYSLWPGGTSSYEWGSLYATHFLHEAVALGYDVNKSGLKRADKYLERLLRDGVSIKSYEHRAYALYVQSLTGATDRSWALRLLEDIELLSPAAQMQLAVTLSKLGESAEALKIMNRNFVQSQERERGGTLSSPVREAALMMLCYLQLSPDHKNVETLFKKIQGQMKDGRWGTTQENGFALLAIGRYMKYLTADNDYVASVAVNGNKIVSIPHTSQRRLFLTSVADKKVSITLNGKGKLYYFWSVDGVPLNGNVEEIDEKISVRREVYDQNDLPADLNAVKSGEIYFIKLTVQSDDTYENVVISDLLPAGFEIENQNLASRQKAVSGIASSLKPDFVDRRDDRMLVFCTTTSEPQEYVYPVRATSKGTFALPPVSAQCQYDETIRSINGAGTISVK